MWIVDAVIVGTLHSVLTFEPLPNHHLEMSRIPNTFVIQYLSLMKTCSHPACPSGEHKALSLVKLPPLTSCSVVPAHIEKKYPFLDLHADFASKKIISQLKGLFEQGRLRGKVEAKT